MKPINRVLSIHSQELALASLDSRSLLVYRYLLGAIGYQATPRPVPLETIAKNTGMNRTQAKYRVKKLIEAKLLEKWTTKHPTRWKISYFRIVYTGNKQILYKRKANLERKLASH